MRRYAGFIAFVLAFVLVWSAAARAGAVPEDPAKKTRLGRYLDAREAYAMWQAAPDKVHVVDVRTVEEYVFVGHATMAVNIPVMLFSATYTPAQHGYTMVDNAGFLAATKARFALDATLLIMCRSGQRAAEAVNRLAAAGYSNVWSITDGFEGDSLKDPANQYHGKRVVNGWKNAGLPWTYALDNALVYQPQ